MIDCFVNSLSKIHDELRKVYPFHALDDPQPFVYSLASRPNVADGLVSWWHLPRCSSFIADLISPHSPPKKAKKRRPEMLCDFFQLLFFTSVWQWATVRVKKLFWLGCSLVFIVHPLEIFGPKRLNFYLRMQVALDMGLAWFRNSKFRPYPPIPPAH